LELLVDQHIFPPSTHGSRFTEYLHVNHGERVIDIGTGSGLLAILAAKKGGSVVATDPSTEAIKRTQDNATRNNVTIDARIGNYFEPFDGNFDVIIANLPQEIITDSYAAQLGELAETISGGPKGNEHILQLLRLAPAHMHPHTRLYIAVYGLSEYITTLNSITKGFEAQLLGLEQGAAKRFVQEEAEWYTPLIEDGTIRLFEREGVWMTEVYFFELRKSTIKQYTNSTDVRPRRTTTSGHWRGQQG
jgi:release factor glutamine methyltransferase